MFARAAPCSGQVPPAASETKNGLSWGCSQLMSFSPPHSGVCPSTCLFRSGAGPGCTECCHSTMLPELSCICGAHGARLGTSISRFCQLIAIFQDHLARAGFASVWRQLHEHVQAVRHVHCQHEQLYMIHWHDSGIHCAVLPRIQL